MPGERGAGVGVVPVGERAVLVEAPGWAPADLAASLRAALAPGAPGPGIGGALGPGAPGPVEDIVAGAASVLVVARAAADLALIGALLAALPAGGPSPAPSEDGEVLEVPVTYDGADLDEVARRAGLSVAEVVAAHQAPVYRAAFCGFAPGFAYLDGLAEHLWLPRRSSPRVAVPAGSVAIADRYSAVYPRASPGGWHLLGRTAAPVWDSGRRPPALLAAGTRVRFVAAGRPGTVPAGEAPRASRPEPSDGVHLEVVDPGLLTTVQDGGRPGLADQGVARSGWLDGPAARLANRLVGNEEGAAVLEATLRGPVLRLHIPGGGRRAVAVTGADLPVSIDGEPVPANAPLEVRAGGRLELGWARSGARAYVAVAGGIDVEPVLGSRATDMLSGLGPPPLAAGQRLVLGADHGRRAALGQAPVAALPDLAVLRARPGPRLDWLGAGALEVLAATTWTVGADSNRVGLRLTGAAVPRDERGELPPEGLVAGAVQIPPSGEPVLFLADHPVTGGYPVVAVVAEADLALAAQLPPGAAVRISLVRQARAGGATG